MRKYLDMIALVIGIISAAVDLIKSFEVPGFGTEKKGIVMELLKGVYNALKDKIGATDVTWDDIDNLISGAIDVIVGFFNAIGVFKKPE